VYRQGRVACAAVRSGHTQRLTCELVPLAPSVGPQLWKSVLISDLGGDDQRGHIWRLHWLTFCSAGLRS